MSPNPVTGQGGFSFRIARAGKAEPQACNQWGKLGATACSRESVAGELNAAPFNSQQLPKGSYRCRAW